MALNDILKSIRLDAEREAENIKKSAQIKISELEKKLNESVGRAGQKILADFKLGIEKKVKQVRFKKEAELKTLVLKKKQEIIEKVYALVLEKLASRGSSEYKKVIEKTVEKLPKVEKGKIMLADNKKGETEIIIKKSKADYKIATETVKSRGGFVLDSPVLRIDNTLESLVKQVRDETGVEVAKVLFE